MFSYANNKFTTAIQTGVVDKCYAFGRTYRGGRKLLGQMLANNLQQTNSILGGTCNASSLSQCPGETSPTRNQHKVVIYYDPPSALVNLMNVAANQWVVVQMYKLVTGTCATTTPSCGSLAWNCNGTWQTHWTSKPELYCYADYMAAVASIPANVLTVDPATVAAAWNLNPGVTQKPLPVVTALSPGGGAPSGGTTVQVTGTGFTGTAGVAFGSNQATSFTAGSDTHITVTSPAGAGIADVAVTTTKGISATSSADQFLYADPPGGAEPESLHRSGGRRDLGHHHRHRLHGRLDRPLRSGARNRCRGRFGQPDHGDEPGRLGTGRRDSDHTGGDIPDKQRRPVHVRERHHGPGIAPAPRGCRMVLPGALTVPLGGGDDQAQAGHGSGVPERRSPHLVRQIGALSHPGHGPVATADYGQVTLMSPNGRKQCPPAS